MSMRQSLVEGNQYLVEEGRLKLQSVLKTTSLMPQSSKNWFRLGKI